MNDFECFGIVWCSTPGCVRPVSYHPDGMHLTEDGLEFSDETPTAPRPRGLRLVQHTADPRHPVRGTEGDNR